MKNWLVIGFLCLLTVFGEQSILAQEVKLPELDKSPMDMAYFPSRAPFRAFEKDEAKKATLTPAMRVIYSRPQLKGRELASLAKPGEVWRLGANESAELDVFQLVNIGGAKVPPGRYTLYAIPGSDEWTLIINADLDGWGAYAYDESKDIARVKGKVSKLDQPVEAFSITFTDDAMVMAWGDTQVTVPVSR